MAQLEKMRPGGLAIAVINESGIIKSFCIRSNSNGRFIDIDPSGSHLNAFMPAPDVELFMEHLKFTLKTGKEMQNTHLVNINGMVDYRFAHIRKISNHYAKVFLTCELKKKD